MSEEIEAAIAREQERLARLLEMKRAGKVSVESGPGVESIPQLLSEIRDAIDQIELAIGVENAKGT